MSPHRVGVTIVEARNKPKLHWSAGCCRREEGHLTKGASVPIDVTFDGQSQARLFATATSGIMATAILPTNVARTFQKASLMVAVSGGNVLNFNLTSTAPLLAEVNSKPISA